MRTASPTVSPGKARTDVLRLLGLAHRAGGVTLGTGAVREAVRRGDARVVMTASDASSAQLDKLRPLLGHREVPEREVGTREELGNALGRAPLTAIAVTNDGFAGRILELLDP